MIRTGDRRIIFREEYFRHLRLMNEVKNDEEGETDEKEKTEEGKENFRKHLYSGHDTKHDCKQ